MMHSDIYGIRKLYRRDFNYPRGKRPAPFEPKEVLTHLITGEETVSNCGFYASFREHLDDPDKKMIGVTSDIYFFRKRTKRITHPFLKKVLRNLGYDLA